MTPEGKVKAAIKKELVLRGIYFFMPRGTAFGRAGVPDIIICHAGKFIGMEVKAGRGKPTALQLREHERIRAAGGIAVVVNESDWFPTLNELMQDLCSS